MPSFHALLSTHAPFLLLDATSSRVQVALCESEASVRWASSSAESNVALFRCIEQLGADPTAVRAFVFCEGPGSILGVRTTAMALRTWCALASRPCFAYQSLVLMATVLHRPVVSDARREQWHLATSDASLTRVATDAIPPHAATPAEFRAWTPLPANVEPVSYDLAQLLPRVADRDLFHSAPEPDAYLHEAPSYVTWTPQIHRAP
jgi:tRNA threonylcarbamoyladenosine biosynthesis protein TsaB